MEGYWQKIVQNLFDPFRACAHGLGTYMYKPTPTSRALTGNIQLTPQKKSMPFYVGEANGKMCITFLLF